MRDMIVVLGAQARSGRDAARQLRAANYYGRVLPAWADIETLAEPFNEFFNKAVMHNIFLGGL